MVCTGRQVLAQRGKVRLPLTGRCVQVVKYWPNKGKSGFLVWRFLLRRDDRSPAPWTKEGKKRMNALDLVMQVSASIPGDLSDVVHADYAVCKVRVFYIVMCSCSCSKCRQHVTVCVTNKNNMYLI